MNWYWGMPVLARMVDGEVRGIVTAWDSILVRIRIDLDQEVWVHSDDVEPLPKGK